MKRGSYRSREKAPPDPRDEYSDILVGLISCIFENELDSPTFFYIP